VSFEVSFKIYKSLKANFMTGSYKDLIVWQKAHANTLANYSLSKILPEDEKFGLVSQIRRAVLSVELNIVEGKYRNTKKEFIHFLYIARGSNQEVHCILEISKDLGFITEEQHTKIIVNIEEVNKMINGLINSLLK